MSGREKMKRTIALLTLLLVPAPSVAEQSPALPETAKFLTETMVSDDLRDRMWCALYTEVVGVIQVLWFECRLDPSKPVSLITYTEPPYDAYVVWEDEGVF